MEKYSIEDIRRAAFKHLHLIFIKKNEILGTYRVVESEKDGIPKIVDYISFHPNTIKLEVKDIGSNIIYLIKPELFNESRIELLLNDKPELEEKIRSWYPFLWGEGSQEDKDTYFSIMIYLQELLDLEEPLLNRNHQSDKEKIDG